MVELEQPPIMIATKKSADRRAFLMIAIKKSAGYQAFLMIPTKKSADCHAWVGSRLWVENFVQQSLPMGRSRSLVVCSRRTPISRLLLTPEQAELSDRIYDALRHAAAADLWQLAELLASRRGRQLLGHTEFEVRDLVHKIGAQAFETALKERKKGGTQSPRLVARTARSRPASGLSPQATPESGGNALLGTGLLPLPWMW
jgi:hypothetical protein